jgi:hypothetical protein
VCFLGRSTFATGILHLVYPPIDEVKKSTSPRKLEMSVQVLLVTIIPRTMRIGFREWWRKEGVVAYCIGRSKQVSNTVFAKCNDKRALTKFQKLAAASSARELGGGKFGRRIINHASSCSSKSNQFKVEKLELKISYG